MIRNYLTIAWRNLLRNQAYALLNVVGLSLGLACGLLVFWFIRFQTTHDAHHAQLDRIYQITTEFHFDGVSHSRGVPTPMWQAVRTEIPELTTSMCIDNRNALLATLDNAGKPQKKFKEKGKKGAYVQPEYFSIFDYQWLSSAPQKALGRPNAIVLSEAMAQRYFGTTNPLGRIIRLDNQLDLEVTGIVNNPPEGTDLPYEFFVSFATLTAHPEFRYGGSGIDHWGGVNSNTYCFVLLPENADLPHYEKQLAAINKKYHGDGHKSYAHPLVPYQEMHHSEIYYGAMPMKWIYIMAAIGVFLIVTACFNFINMATAQALRRSKEVGVRKSVGGTRGQVFIQFMVETALITLVALVLGVALAAYALPHFDTWLEEAGGWPKSIRWDDTLLWGYLIALFGVVVLLAGSYPGLILAGFRPVLALKGGVTARQIGGMSIRRVLIGFQFMLIQLLVIGTIVVNNQVDYMLSRSVGYNTQGLVQIPVPEPGKINQSTFRERLLTIPGVANASFCLFLPTTQSNNTSNFRFDTRQEDEVWQMNTKNADDHYIETFGLELVAGQNIPPSDTIRGYLINEKVVERLGLKSPQEAVGKNLRVWGVDAPIYGVLKNWNNTSFQSGIDPVAIFTMKDIHYSCGVKLSTSNMHQTLGAVEKLWNEYFPDYLYEQSFMDEEIARSYILENIMLKLIRVFSGLAIFIGCLGLYGLIKFMASQKTKEIGVRKVLGASIGNILGLFGKEIAVLIAIAFLVAGPLGWYFMNQWLQDYEYRIPINAGILLLAIGLTFVVAGLTASYESLKAALTNPTKALRSE
ncbi:ABC transporter permease [Rhabdobacter roseus]|uniref:ABC-type antimicrobial peptide transport system permease subunit n=1 Tax=Rhabdobacter roseus TaxID=1655419 RepID=A0A840U196_9BACT|nr:FtsX-like permease family protein [Rhabdobacter roseus]MBB5285639.1 ABC-type antimicrobial peptide transport system permease subunit [Rhabdobacter roseus]